MRVRHPPPPPPPAAGCAAVFGTSLHPCALTDSQFASALAPSLCVVLLCGTGRMCGLRIQPNPATCRHAADVGPAAGCGLRAAGCLWAGCKGWETVTLCVACVSTVRRVPRAVLRGQVPVPAAAAARSRLAAGCWSAQVSLRRFRVGGLAVPLCLTAPTRPPAPCWSLRATAPRCWILSHPTLTPRTTVWRDRLPLQPPRRRLPCRCRRRLTHTHRHMRLPRLPPRRLGPRGTHPCRHNRLR